jgi:hypothetical protein
VRKENQPVADESDILTTDDYAHSIVEARITRKPCNGYEPMGNGHRGIKNKDHCIPLSWEHHNHGIIIVQTLKPHAGPRAGI